MMARFILSGTDGKTLAKRMLKLAWDASSCVGMGFLQDRGPGMTEGQVFENANESGRVQADYVFGRMMKLYFQYDADSISFHQRQWRSDYQSFCGKYPDFDSLVLAAAKSLSASVEQEQEVAAKQ